MGHARLTRSLVALTASALLTAPSLAAGPVEWAQSVWNSAKNGDGSTFTLLNEPTGEALLPGLSGFKAHAEEREQARLERLSELAGELDEALASDDHEEALRVLLEKQDLEGDPVGFAMRPDVKSVTDEAARVARAFEAGNEWLPAFRLFSLLHVLHEVDRAYQSDWQRLSQRRAMIGFYAPERLYEMVSAELIADGEEALPPFNQSGPTWRERVRGLETDMVAQALKRASQRHIEEVPIRDMLVGGFDALRVMATTPELAQALPQLSNETDVRDFVERLDANATAIAALEGELRFFHIDRAMRVLERINQESVNLPMEALLHEFGNGATAQLDEYSSFYWPETIERANRTTQGNFKGVGIQITQNEKLELEVITPVAGTPAFRAGIRPGDIIAEIEGVPALGLDTNSAVERITGPAGSSVTLGIKREGTEGLIDFTLNRAVITLYAARGWERKGESEKDWDWFVDKEAGIGYIRLSQFLNGATEQTASAIRSMKRQGLNGLILDLRYNSGGLLNEAVDLANLFVDSGVVVTQEDADGMVQDIQRAKRGRALLEDIPVVVLVNGGSASASEIVAGALQDYGKAVLVGTRTFGKGSVQRIFPLDRAGRAAFKLTTQYYKLPSGRLIHRTPGSSDWGIAPDVEVRMMPSEISDALQLRRDADVITRDARGNLIAEATDPTPLVTEGVDAQLQTAVMLLRTKVEGDRLAQRDTP